MTQPARKKETATQLELLEAELTAARKVTARYRTAMENAEKRHGAAEDAQAVAQYRYDCALVASWGDTPDWMTLLDGDEDRSSVMYELAREGLERLGLGTSMINMETGYRSFLKKNHPTELERYDEACEALRREEFARFAELQTLGLYLHLQVQQKEAQFRRRRNRLLLGMTITGVMTSVLLYANFYPEQLQLISHELATLPGRISGFVGRLLH